MVTSGAAARVLPALPVTFSNKPILITGCQRSGTTLLNLILNSHSQVTAVDEDQFQVHKLADYLMGEQYHPYICFKLPKVSEMLPALGVFPHLSVLWCIRDPRDVVTSMWNRPVGFNPSIRGRLLALLGERRFNPSSVRRKNRRVAVSWLAHPNGARAEIRRCLRTLEFGPTWPSDLEPYRAHYERIRERSPLVLSKRDETLLGALVWRLKNQVFVRHANLDFVRVVVYEQLVTSTESVLRDILGFLNIPWDDKVLRHHEIHSGITVGGTDSGRPVDASGVGRWSGSLQQDQLELIEQICGGLDLGYGLGPESDGSTGCERETSEAVQSLGEMR